MISCSTSTEAPPTQQPHQSDAILFTRLVSKLCFYQFLFNFEFTNSALMEGEGLMSNITVSHQGAGQILTK